MQFDAWQLLWQEGVKRDSYSTGTYTETGDTRDTAAFSLVARAGLPWTGVGGVVTVGNIGS